MAPIRFPTAVSFVLAVLALAAGLTGVAAAQSGSATSQRLVVVVNDQPITDYDVQQRIRLNDALGYSKGSEAQQRKDALQELIDDVIKKAEAKRNNIEPTESQIDESIEKMVKGMGTTVEKLTGTLKANGISMTTLRQYVKASIAFNLIATRRYNIKIELDPAEVDRRHASFASDPRLKPVLVYELQDVTLPVEKTSEAMMGQLLYARAVEAQQIMQRYKGCASAREAASGVFNVKIGKIFQAPAEELPKDMKAALDKAGPGKLLGPMRASNGIQLIGFCGRRNIEPPKPTREMVENMLRNEKYQRAAQRILRDLRRSAYIDYKNETTTQ